MSILPKDTVKTLAEAAGISNLKDEIASSLASDAEYRLREVVQEALKFMRHAKRQKLSTDDVNHALRVRNLEPMYGFKSKEPLIFRKIPGTSTDLYYLPDDEVDFNDIINAPPPKLPLEPAITTHWLAIDGQQPQVSQNPPAIQTEKDKEKEEREDKEEIVVNVPSVSIEGDDNVQVKPLVKHVLSKELQQYYEKIVESVLRKEPDIRKAALNSLRVDAGIHQLVPYFCQFVSDKIAKNLKNLEVLWAAVRIVESLLHNPNLFMEPYLHQLMPSVLTCLVGRQLGSNPKKGDHWELRDFAAQLVGYICSQYGEAYQTLQPRVAKTLLRAFLDPMRPLTTHYGAIIGLGALGREVIRVLLIPNVKIYGDLLQKQLQTAQKNEVKRLEAEKCQNALANVIGMFLKEEQKNALPKTIVISPEDEKKPLLAPFALPKTPEEYEQMFGILGEKILPFVSPPS